ncbi:hypothetical protein TOPH_06237 [Tolypocladium ophioglossoides CBS 100239]|uniref:Uncharacterized protein n=1 Tax=Tolypocladium ophioglossoides (strain CBS 100239) TaxID=1163406 RepID=A0A0L0N4T5_TOLOC|nr:hypothetical protein TOPH_06237 [Tolypocladium ophioglossoides CBS 100239]
MRFTFVTIIAALAGSALSAPTSVAKRSLVNQVGSVVEGLEKGLPVSQIENALGGLPLADKLLSLAQGDNLTGLDLTAIGEALAMVTQGTPIDAVNSFLNATTSGVVSNLEKTLDVGNIGDIVQGLVSGIL